MDHRTLQRAERARVQTRSACAAWVARQALPQFELALEGVCEIELPGRQEQDELRRVADTLTAVIAELRELERRLDEHDADPGHDVLVDELAGRIVRRFREAEAVVCHAADVIGGTRSATR
jgi:hypothetical protein